MNRSPRSGPHVPIGRPIALVLAGVLATGTAPAASTPLAVRLAPGADAGELVFSLVNTSDAPIGVLPAGTPLEPVLSEDVFEVTRPSKTRPPLERAPYTGRLAKRAPPEEDDVVTIPPGGSLDATLRLARHYAIPDGDDYRVRFTGEVRQVSPLDTTATREGPRTRAPFAPRPVRPAGDPLTLALEPDLSALSRARPPTFADCDAGQQLAIVEATLAAEGIAGESLSSLRGLPEARRPDSPRYRRWFGAHDPARYASVARGYERILDSLAGATLNYDCGCRETGLYAYVRPIFLHDVNLCPRFFAAPVLGTDSRAGTLVHELSHFTALLGTDDTVYGQDAAALLAARDPALAIDNADNVEYFAENAPPLPMSADEGAVPRPESVDAPVDGPSGGADASAFVRLDNGVERRGSVDEGGIDRYAVEGVDVVGILSERGDADLYVYDDPVLGEAALVCRADGDGGQSPIDYCELPGERRTWYVAVLGFTDADYRIVANTLDTPGLATPPVPDALAGGAARGRLDRGESVTYAAEAPLRVELTSTSGDADLLVFAGTRATADAELCRSIEEQGPDVCELRADGPVLLVVTGYSEATFELATSALDGGATADAPGPPVPSDDDPGVPPGAVPGDTRPTAPPADDGGAAGPLVGASADGGSGGSGGGGGRTGWPSLLVGAALVALVRRRRTGAVAGARGRDPVSGRGASGQLLPARSRPVADALERSRTASRGSRALTGATLAALALSACTSSDAPRGAAGTGPPASAPATPMPSEGAARPGATREAARGAARGAAQGAAQGAAPATRTAPSTDAPGVGAGRDDADVVLVAETSALRARSSADEALELRVSVRNDTDRTLPLLLWNTPFEETPSADLFAVTRDGVPVPYRGRLIKRAAPPSGDDVARLAPGETLERTVSLGRDYDVERPGTYRIRFVPPPLAADGGPVRLAGDGREIVVERR